MTSRRQIVSISVPLGKKQEMLKAAIAFIGKGNLSLYFKLLHDQHIGRSKQNVDVLCRVEILLKAALVRLNDVLVDYDYAILSGNQVGYHNLPLELSELNETLAQIKSELESFKLIK